VAMEIIKIHVTLYVVPEDSKSEILIPSYKTVLSNVLNSRQYQGVY
jgi:hypothetical protein